MSRFGAVPLEQKIESPTIGHRFGAVPLLSAKKEEATVQTSAPSVSDNLPETLSFAGMDTGIPLNKKFAAGLVGAGHMLGDAVRGTGQVLGLVDEEKQNSDEAAMDKLYADPEVGTAALGGAVVGALAEPVGILLPGAKGKKLLDVAKKAAVVGGAYGALGYVDEDESRLANAAIGAVAGGTIAPTVVKFARSINNVGMNSVAKIANKDLVTLKKEISDIKIANPKLTPTEAEEQAMTKLGYSREGVDDLIVNANVTNNSFKKAGYTGQRQKILEEFEQIAAIGQPTKFNKLVAGAVKKVMVKPKKYLQGVTDNVKSIDENVGRRLRQMEFDSHRASSVWGSRVRPFQEIFNGLKPEDQATLARRLYNGNFDGAERLLKVRAGDDGVKALDGVKSVTKDVLGELRKVGYKIPTVDNYFPRLVKDLDGIRTKEENSIKEAILRAEKNSGPLSLAQRERLIRNMLEGDVRFAKTSGSLNKRNIKVIPEELMPYYHNPVIALDKYIANMSEDIARRKFFKDLGYVPGEKGLSPNGSDIDASIDSIFINKLKDLNREDASNLVKLLRNRFVDSDSYYSKTAQALKNLSYASTLGNYKSAITQFGDIVIPAQRYGILDTIWTMFGGEKIRYKGKWIKIKPTTKEQLLGDAKIVQELAEEDSVTKRIADFAFKWGGFQRVDKFGKEVAMNTALKKFIKMTADPKQRAELRKTAFKYFGNDGQQLITDLEKVAATNGEDISDNVYFLLFNELSEAQPITKSEVPAAYWELGGKGRLFYAYKTFTIKQLNYMYNNIVEDFLKGNRASAVKKAFTYVSLYTVVNGSLDGAKDFIFNHDADSASISDLALNNIYSLVGTSQYTYDKLENQDLFGAFWDAVKPVPVTQTANIVNQGYAAITDQDMDELYSMAKSNVPVLNKAFEAMGFVE